MNVQIYVGLKLNVKIGTKEKIIYIFKTWYQYQMAKTIYLYFSCLKAKVNFGLFNIDIAFVCAKSCHLWSDRADHALYKICIHRRLSSGLSHFLAQARDCFARGVRTCRQSVRIEGILQSSMSFRGNETSLHWLWKNLIWINVISLKDPNKEYEVQKTYPKSAQGTRKASHGRCPNITELRQMTRRAVNFFSSNRGIVPSWSDATTSASTLGGCTHPHYLTDLWMQKSNDSVRITIRTRDIEDILSKFQTCKYADGINFSFSSLTAHQQQELQ